MAEDLDSGSQVFCTALYLFMDAVIYSVHASMPRVSMWLQSKLVVQQSLQHNAGNCTINQPVSYYATQSVLGC